ncbi:MAG: sugar phosphate isomerase/epimerase family protein [Spirochaetota bacterium]
MYLTGITDEAADSIEEQIAVCRQLGWRWIDLRTVDGTNVTNLSDARFDHLLGQLDDAGVRVSSFCGAIANWGRRIDDPFEVDLEELNRAIPRMHRAGTTYLRIMSYRPEPGAEAGKWSDAEIEKEVIRRVREITRRAEDGGIVCLHENCDTWGGQSFEHTLRLLDEIDSSAFSLVFDTGNPVETLDKRAGASGRYQDAYEFYKAVREHISYVHIKDGYRDGEQTIYTQPGDGHARIAEILRDLHRRGYDGGVSIEPHVAVVHHDPSVTADEQVRRDAFVEYARRTKRLLEQAGYGG